MADSQDVEVPQGAAFAFEQATTRLAGQLQDIRDLDTKIGVAIAALGAVVVALVAQRLPTVFQGVLSAWLLLGLIQAIRAFLVGRYAVAPEARPLAERYSGGTPDSMMWVSLPAVLDAIDDNQPKLFQKGLRLNQLMVTLGAVAGSVLIAKMLGVA